MHHRNLRPWSYLAIPLFILCAWYRLSDTRTSPISTMALLNTVRTLRSAGTVVRRRW